MSSVNNENFDERFAVVVASIDDESHRKQIVEYIHERRANGFRVTTLIANVNVLRTFANFLKKPFMEASRADLNGYVNHRTGQRVYRNFDRHGNATETKRKVRRGDSTMAHHKVVIRCFYKWLNDGEYPHMVAHLKTRTGRNNDLTSDRLVTREELALLLQAADDLRMKALVSFMWESGLRAGELVALNVGSVVFDDVGAKVTIPSKAEGLKTGSRTVRVLSNESAPHLQRWYDSHPNRGDPDAALFHGMSRRNPRGRMLAASLYAAIVTLVQRAGIKRHIKPHDFRHTAATEKARLGYNEAHLRHYFGWSRTSDMPTHYVHLAGEDFEEMMLERHGVAVPQERPRQVMHAACPTCAEVNDTTSIYCNRCRRLLKPAGDPAEASNDILLQTVREVVKEALQSLHGRS